MRKEQERKYSLFSGRLQRLQPAPNNVDFCAVGLEGFGHHEADTCACGSGSASHVHVAGSRQLLKPLDGWEAID